ncbi:MAG: class I SAM-dependent methyltransferase, partial [Parvibaculum sp.]
KELAESFDGMMNPISIALFEALLGFQKAQGVTGNCIEFGVYRGRSASIILKHMGRGEQAMLVDVADYPQLDRLRLVNPAFEFVKGKSEDLTNDPRITGFVAKGVRFSHHDASHSYVNVSAEMALMEPHIAPRGLMVLDDFGNPNYMQVIAACFHHLAQSDCTLEVLLFANNKAYLCRKEDFDFYSNFLIEGILPLLIGAGLSVYLTRTERNPRYRAFSIVPKMRPTDPDRYGINIFGDRFYKV